MTEPYQSDVTRFLAELKRQKPHLEAEQRKGRALLWDKVIDPELQQDFQAARVPQKPYVYQPDL